MAYAGVHPTFLNCDLFADAPRSLCDSLAAVATEVYAGRLDDIYRTGDDAGDFYVIKQGLVCLSVETRSARNDVVLLLGAGRAFGWTSLVVPAPRTHWATALADSVVWKVPVSALRNAADAEPSCAAAVYRNGAAMLGRVIASMSHYLKDEPTPAEHVELCPALVTDGRFRWRLGGAVVEAVCSGRPDCGVPDSACPLVNGPSSEWSTLMLGKFTPVAAR